MSVCVYRSRFRIRIDEENVTDECDNRKLTPHRQYKCSKKSLLFTRKFTNIRFGVQYRHLMLDPSRRRASTVSVIDTSREEEETETTEEARMIQIHTFIKRKN